MSSLEKQVLLVAGEASADRYASRLVEALKAAPGGARWRFVGTGGDRMAASGVKLVAHIRDLASIGPSEALSHLGRYVRTYRALVRLARTSPVDVAVLLDFPDFNLPLARKLKRLGIPVVYYISPQLWAWRQGRVRTVRRFVDRMLVILPFEEPFYRERGVMARFVGHPLLEEFEVRRDRRALFEKWGLQPDVTTVAVLPGSRWREVEYLLPVFADAGLELFREMPVQFAVSAAPSVGEERLRSILGRVSMQGGAGPLFRVIPDDSRDILANSDFGWVKSGTSTLEAALVGTPFLIAYRLSALSLWLARVLVRSPHIGLVNLIAREEIVPELIQDQANPKEIARVTAGILADPSKIREMTERLAGVRGLLGTRTATDAAAQEVLSFLGN